MGLRLSAAQLAEKILYRGIGDTNEVMLADWTANYDQILRKLRE